MHQVPSVIGRTLGHYRIKALLGRGGMGEVYRAWDARLERDVALKVLPEKTAADPVRLERFRREAKTVAGMSNPHIVKLFSVEEADGIHFLTMELIEGKALDSLLHDGPPSFERLCEIGIGVAEALAAAHEKGVVHRDLKPANVMVGKDGHVQVLDFGLAKLTEETSPDDETRSQLTADGTVLGTASYMSPEQVRGSEVDHRSDLFSMGILLFELATGYRPFKGETFPEIAASILRDTPPLLTNLNPKAPGPLADIVARCLEKEPSRRLPSADEVANQLRALRDELKGLGSGGTTPEPGAKISKPPPVPPTPLLGRDAALESASRSLREGVRILTVTGSGGTGKTRFSVELFRRLEGDFPGGAAFVSLASVTSAADALPAVTSALGIPEAHGRSALEALCTVIGQKRVLLVLDNLEQVLDAAEDISRLVSRCPGLQCVTTSRGPLKIGAEIEFTLPPLALPPPGVTSLERLQQVPSVALFVQRAGRVKPGFTLTESNAAAIAEICLRLDGLPLALELAAARVRVLEPAALLQRLDRALDLLTSGDRDLPARQRTLRAAISWSYSLLDPSEQSLLRRLSCFHEGFTLEAIEEVCYEAEDRGLALDELDSLVEKGLVGVEASGTRYSLLQTIQAFAAEQLDASGEQPVVRDRHANYFVQFAGQLAKALRTTEQLDAMRRWRPENSNTHTAIQWLTLSAQTGNEQSLEKGLLLCGSLNWFWHLSAQHLTALVSLDTLLDLAADRPPSRGRALAQLAAGMASTGIGEWERSRDHWQAGFEDAEVVGDQEAAAEGLMGVGYCSLSLGDVAPAGAALSEAIARSEGTSEFIQALALSLKGLLLFATGDLEAGRALVGSALEIQARIGDHEGGGVAKSFLAQMTFAEGNPNRALELYREALASLETVGDYPEVARVLCEIGWTALSACEPGTAMESFRRAVEAYQRVGSPRGTGLALLGIAAVEAAQGRSESAVAVAAAAQALSERAGVVIDHPMDPTVVNRIEALKSTIPQATLSGLEAKARVLTADEVLAMTAERG